MTTILIVLLSIDAILAAVLIAYLIVGICRKPNVNEGAVAPSQVTEVPQQKAEPVVIKKVEEPKAIPVVEPINEVAVAEEPTVMDEPVAMEESDALDLDKTSLSPSRIPFAVKLLDLEDNIQEYFDKINNAFYAYRKVNIRISIKGVSYRFKKELIAKIAIRGKTMKLYLALDPNKLNKNVYFQKDCSDVKTYAEVPCSVKVKSDRGLKKSLELVDMVCAEKGVERKTRVAKPLDSIAILESKLQ